MDQVLAFFSSGNDFSSDPGSEAQVVTTDYDNSDKDEGS